MDVTDWWGRLEEQWQQAFTICFFQQPGPYSTQQLEQLTHSKVLRFVGPSAPFPNMPFTLTNLSGLSQFINLEILVVTHHEIRSLAPLQKLANLKSLFAFNNQLQSLKGIEGLTNLGELYVQHNCVTSLEPIKNLTSLKSLYVSDNHLTTFGGLTDSHGKLQKFYGLPNGELKQKEVLKLERKLGIRCLNG